MSTRPLMFTVVSIAVTAVATITPCPAIAQRWLEVVKTDHLEGSLDMDSLIWEGSKVTYRTLFKKPQAGSTEKRTIIATAAIDCATHKRQFVRSESRLPDGSVRKGSAPSIWEPIDSGTLTAKIERIVCTQKS